ncbi:NADPH:quinone reductase-like Zn-dependent oxidoreductase [Novosphingobium hassiacum]|uniref:NADPH:quinone reductase-like Zn-dependent oxidoreductase n=1 Tax=Novosphingobium hassiacum TaxID=173676 RepID=A0A7W6EWT6_9SPHN|nr:zinc-binding dehydrogenase [Novosphingobium hassiacum]MBB3861633.1 NADPH:quinone reductase-like Zn-dependent oxidoreductase [Novosphingobium hassiacum]
MTQLRGQQLVSKLDEDGTLTVELADHDVPAPTDTQVVIRVEAAPINPSDLGLLFGPADIENATFSPGKIVAKMPEAAVRAMKSRHGLAMPVGNEGAGTVVAAGDAPAAQALLGKRVTCFPGGMYATYAVADAAMCLELGDDVSAEQGASAFVNPLTALSFTETMRYHGHKALVHTAAASNLGQMLVKICQADGIPLVNVVRSEAQVAILKDIGAEHVVDSSKDSFLDDLTAAVDATKATMAFDAIGGGKLVSQIMTVMEQVANSGAAYSRYGSNSPKHAFIYGALDLSPTVLTRNFGFSWDVSGWLLTPWMGKLGPEIVGKMRARVLAELTTTFASNYKARVTLEQALSREAALDYNARRTGEKYLITPAG